MSMHNIYAESTAERGDSKPVDSKLQWLVNFLLHTKISIHSINQMKNQNIIKITENPKAAAAEGRRRRRWGRPEAAPLFDESWLILIDFDYVLRDVDGFLIDFDDF